jgi:Raf kinase inhibitor-like YbhB/YbcL family protein
VETAMIVGRRWLAAVIAFALVVPVGIQAMEAEMTLSLSSPAFAPGAPMDARHTCDGDEVSPALRWSGAPGGTASFALIVDDPDAPDPAAPQRTWVHWVLYDLPATTHALPEAVAASQLPAGTRQGVNDWNRTGYGAPCPPKGRHRYVFKLYALDRLLPDLHKPDKAQLLKAMEGHVIAHAELIGTYQRGH